MKIRITPERANEALQELRKKGDVSFDGKNGTFSVSGVSGRFDYDNDNQVLSVIIDDTPFLVSEDYCYSEIRKYFTD